MADHDLRRPTKKQKGQAGTTSTHSSTTTTHSHKAVQMSHHTMVAEAMGHSLANLTRQPPNSAWVQKAQQTSVTQLWSPCRFLLALDELEEHLTTGKQLDTFQWDQAGRGVQQAGDTHSTETQVPEHGDKKLLSDQIAVPLARMDMKFDPMTILRPGDDGKTKVRLVQCRRPSCRSYDTMYSTVQRKADDEGYSLDCTCRKCGNQWIIS
jgi:DNA-directed RNA polymerase subunit M/transcription elongation factor TFIIS